MNENEKQTTHFGYRDVPVKEKEKLVDQVFSSVADRYDLMNDLMSMGMHRLWKRHFVATAGIRPDFRILDLAGGTGDISALMAPRLGPEGQIILADINAAMLSRGRDRLLDSSLGQRVRCAQVNAEALPFADGSFDLVTMAFGLRNVTDKAAALASMQRVLKPGGRVMVLEFSQIKPRALRPLYDWYSFKVLPRIGARVAGDPDSYQYLAESIRKHPDQSGLETLMTEAGFQRCQHRNLTAGVVAIHTAIRP
jgi:demethylmenaquinone methyltransferase/2-methoxy-6-polyprenyl-1,4-benzoquinol methylase